MSVLESALAALREGDAVRAEALVVERAREAEREHGRDHAAFAEASFDVAQVLAGAGELRRAASALRDACAVSPGTPDGEKQRLTYVMNLGEVLSRLGDLDDADAVLSDGLDGRAALYGVEHAGYAFGLESLAEVRLLLGDADGASELVDEALRILWKERHPRVAAVLALRAHVRKASSELALPAFEAMVVDELPDPVFDELVAQSLRRAETGYPDLALAVLADLRQRIVERRGRRDPALPSVVAAITNVARAADEEDARIDAFLELVQLLELAAEPTAALDAVQGLALALGEAGRHDEADRSYRDAVERARTIGDDALRSQVLRNFGLYCSKRGRTGDAGDLLDQAVEAARSRPRTDMLGRALAARGIFRQHGHEPEGARSDLDEALRALPDPHPDRAVASRHLASLDGGRPCGCGEVDDAITRTLRARVLAELPDDLLDDITASVGDDGDLELSVRLARAPTAEEAERLEAAVRRALGDGSEPPAA